MFEATPILFKGLLYLTTPFDEIIALDPSTGSERWRYQPPLQELHEGNLITSRGVATWTNQDFQGNCSSRIFVGTNDAQLIGVDSSSGKPCEGFGQNGRIDLKEGLNGNDRSFHVTSAPTVVGNIVVVGSSIPDNQEVDAARGTVRAYDAKTGKMVWTWEPVPHLKNHGPSTGAANAWSTIAADSDRGLLFVPTGSAAPDYYGGMRPGDGRDADSVVALEGTTGREVWAFQVVHHDLWDYDVASEPLLFTWHGSIPALAITTKMGMVFVLDRRTGVPLAPVVEKPVPKSYVAGELASPTQPFSSLPSLSPLTLPASGFVARSAVEEEFCREQIKDLRYDGMYTPPSLKGSLVFPGSLGGVNWGSAAYDPQTGIIYANTNSLPYAVQLIPNTGLKASLGQLRGIAYGAGLLILMIATFLVGVAALLVNRLRTRPMLVAFLVMLTATLWFWHKKREVRESNLRRTIQSAFGHDRSPQRGAPYSLYRYPVVDHNGLPCTPGPWGTVTALDLQKGTIVWEKPHGRWGTNGETGLTSLGGVIATAGGLVFSAGTREPIIRAYDSSSGEELWHGDLPVPAQSTPMTYEINGRQFLVIAAGGHGLWGTKTGDSVVAFSLN